MKVIVTGSNGFLGKIISYDLKKNGFKPKNLIFKQICKQKDSQIKKIIEKKILKINPDAIIHCATFFSKSKNNLTKKKTLRINYKIPKLLFNIAVKNNISKFINIGSAHEFEKDKSKFYPYLSSKKKFTEFLLKNKKKIKIVSIYIFNTFGLNDRRKKLINLVTNGKQEINISNNLKINFLNIKTISKFILQILDKNQKKNTILIGLRNKNYFNTRNLQILNLKNINLINRISKDIIRDHKIKLPFKTKFFDNKIDDVMEFIKKNIC